MSLLWEGTVWSNSAERLYLESVQKYSKPQIFNGTLEYTGAQVFKQKTSKVLSAWLNKAQLRNPWSSLEYPSKVICFKGCHLYHREHLGILSNNIVEESSNIVWSIRMLALQKNLTHTPPRSFRVTGHSRRLSISCIHVLVNKRYIKY